MVHIVCFTPRVVKARGALPSPINEKALRNYLLDDELEIITSLSKITLPSLSFTKPVLFYPGCGPDIIFPLLYLGTFFPHSTSAVFILLDKDDYFPLIKTVLDDIGIGFSDQQEEITFYWKECLVHLQFIKKDVFNLPDNLPEFNIYFERAFRILKAEHRGYEEMIYARLSPGGVVISDSGFQQSPLRKLFIPPQLSSYGEMIFGIKE